ncbi:hypothetical protein AS149_25755 [Burkholderia cenocepacia]|nr:hypothetical protein AS149_25755 [Burkholderia cenocepacia]
MFRGQHGEHDNWAETRLGSLSFGTREAASTYALRPNRRDDTVIAAKVFPVFLDIRNPLVNQQHAFLDLDQFEDIFGPAQARRVAVKFADYIYGTNPWAEVRDGFESIEQLAASEPKLLREMYFELYPLLDDAEEVAFLRQHGFDGAIYAGSGANAMQPEYRVFSATQVRSIWDTSFVPC